jgi:hypothetical protein
MLLPRLALVPRRFTMTHSLRPLALLGILVLTLGLVGLGACQPVDEEFDSFAAEGPNESPDVHPEEEEAGEGESGEGEAVEVGELSEAQEDIVAGLELGSRSGNVRTYLTDAPGDYDEVWVTISSVQIHRNGDSDAEWITLSEEEQTYDLLTLQDAVTAILGDAAVLPGSYSQLRMIVADAWVVVDGEEHDLTIPSGAKTGIKINLNFTVEEGAEYVVVIDFDADKSIKKTGMGYLMTPVLKIALLGEINEEGEVVPVAQDGDEKAKDGEEKDPEELGEPEGLDKPEPSGSGDGVPQGDKEGLGDLPEGAGGSEGDGDLPDEGTGAVEGGASSKSDGVGKPPSGSKGEAPEDAQPEEDDSEDDPA